jgi:putative MATE family efflux protein
MEAVESRRDQGDTTWTLIKEAVAGSERDLTKLPIGRAIFLLALPMVIEMIWESVFAVVDIYWVAKIGPAAVATVGLTEQIMIVAVFTTAMGLSMGCSAIVARRIGEGDPDGAARAAVHGIFLGILLAIVLGTLGVILAPQILAILGAEPDVIAGASYTRVLLGGCGTVVMLFLINAAFRGAGDATVAMRTLILANTINMILCPLLVFGVGPFPELGVAGAAIATTTGRGIGVLYQLHSLRVGRGRLRVRREHLVLDPALLKSMLKLARNGVVQIFISTASWVGLVRVLSTFGTNALAGYQIGIRIVMFALLPSWGMANAAATLVGQNLGAGRPERSEQAVWRASFYNLAFLGSVGVAFFLGADFLVGLFTTDPEVQRYAALCLRIVGLGFPFYAFGMVAPQAFNGAGDTRTPTRINMFCFWGLEIPLAFLLAHFFGMGPTGVFSAITVAFCSVAVISVTLFRRGAWKRVKV